MFSRIQGRVCRTDQFGEFRLTETIYDPLTHLPDHVHEFGCFGFVLQGEFEEQFGSQTLDFDQSSVFFRPPQIVHGDRIESRGARCFYVEVSPVWLEHIRRYTTGLKGPTVFSDVLMRTLASQIYGEWRQPDDVTPLAIEGLAFSMAAQLCRSARPNTSGKCPPWVKHVREMIECRFNETLSLQELADEVSLHPVHVARQFRRYVGTSVGEFVRLKRVDFARHELAVTDKPLVDIALESGFAQQAHFTTVFRRVTGTTPGQYRKLARKN